MKRGEKLDMRLVLASMMIVAACAVAAPASAYDEASTTSGSTASKTFSSEELEKKRQELQEQPAKSKTEVQANAEAKRKELQAQVEDKKQAIRQKLSDQRLKICKEHQDKINKIVDGSKTRGQKVLERLQAAETKVRAYYERLNITLANYDALSAVIDDKEAAAIAAVNVTGDTQFSCDSDDATRPGGIISDTMRSQHSALKAYRDSIRDLIKAIREAKQTTEGVQQ